MQRKIDYFPTEAGMYIAAAELIRATARKAVKRTGRFSFALAGGKTPLPLYRLLLNAAFPWGETDFFWGDERCVPPQDSESNYANAMKSFLWQAAVPEENIHRIKTELTPEQAAVDYEAELCEFKKNNGREKLFDLVLLGMGEDGHTASLFPGSQALKEKKKLVLAVPPPETVLPAIPRITLTYPAIADSRLVFFLIKGNNKKELLASGKRFPAAAVKSEKIIWFAS